MMACGKCGLLEPFCLHASVLYSRACAYSTSSIISLLWEIIREEKECLFLFQQYSTINSGDCLQIKVQCQLSKTWQSNSLLCRDFITVLQWNPCHVASHLTLFLFLLNDSAQWCGQSYHCGWKDGKKLTLYSVCKSFCGMQKYKCGQ